MTNEQAITMIRDAWDNANLSTRLQWCNTCGWASRTAQKLARSSWETLSPAARTVLIRYVEYGKITQ